MLRLDLFCWIESNPCSQIGLYVIDQGKSNNKSENTFKPENLAISKPTCCLHVVQICKKIEQNDHVVEYFLNR